MIFGIGIDMIELERMQKSLRNPNFIHRVFSGAEIAYCESRGKQACASYAARFAGKEAVLKALGIGLRGGALTEIEICNDALGCPHVSLDGYFKQWTDERQIDRIYISLSHSQKYAIAEAICWRD